INKIYSLREIYHDKGLVFPDDFDSTQTVPPIHFVEVSAPDDVDIDDLKRVKVPDGLTIEIHDYHF
ncbi:hypothetical protein ASPZODRAFT_56254, partial [Penicilliopsis zonata CBS 506.65]